MPATAKKPVEPTAAQDRPAPALAETNGKVTTIYPGAKAATPKSPKVAKPKARIDRVAAADVIAFLDQVGITRSQLAQAMKVSPSLVTEWVGKGRGNLLAKSRWAEVQKTARAFAKGIK